MISNISLEHDSKVLGIKNFQGVYSKDKLPNPMKPGKYIANMQNSIVHGKQGNGTHWIMVDVRPEESIYIDPFGVAPPPVIIQRATKPLHYSTQQVEDIDSNLCGWICLFLLNENSRGNNYQDILNLFQKFPKTKENRYIIDKYFGIKSR